MPQLRTAEVDRFKEASARDDDAAWVQRTAVRVLEQDHCKKGGPQHAILRPAVRFLGIEVTAIAWRQVEICFLADANTFPDKLLLRRPPFIGRNWTWLVERWRHLLCARTQRGDQQHQHCENRRGLHDNVEPVLSRTTR